MDDWTNATEFPESGGDQTYSSSYQISSDKANGANT